MAGSGDQRVKIGQSTARDVHAVGGCGKARGRPPGYRVTNGSGAVHNIPAARLEQCVRQLSAERECLACAVAERDALKVRWPSALRCHFVVARAHLQAQLMDARQHSVCRIAIPFLSPALEVSEYCIVSLAHGCTATLGNDGGSLKGSLRSRRRARTSNMFSKWRGAWKASPSNCKRRQGPPPAHRRSFLPPPSGEPCLSVTHSWLSLHVAQP
jgi:hypothetical protein